MRRMPDDTPSTPSGSPPFPSSSSSSTTDSVGAATSGWSVNDAWYSHSSAPRINSDAYIYSQIQSRHRDYNITIIPEQSTNLLAYAQAGHAQAIPIGDAEPSLLRPLKWRFFAPPSRRSDGPGYLADMIFYGEFMYRFKDHDFYIYLIDGRDGGMSYPEVRNYYVIGDESAINDLIMAVGQWRTQLHDEIWVFNQGWWQKSAELYRSIQKASWDDVILDHDMKAAIQNDVGRFFDSRETYEQLRVPWKRGLIFHGPPGNGKTISVKAISHSLYARKEPIPTLYVRTLTSIGGPEYSISLIFAKARAEAPCFLVFEDLDSIVSDNVRSYFLNEVDGLLNNDGILMVGSTNHLDRLDPGIAKRPSRFDRKYLFPNPNEDERVMYCEYWRRKLRENDAIEFPHKLSKAIATITYDFSFAYIQEAFVASLLEIAADSKELRAKSRTHAARWSAESKIRDYSNVRRTVVRNAGEPNNILLARCILVCGIGAGIRLFMGSRANFWGLSAFTVFSIASIILSRGRQDGVSGVNTERSRLDGSTLYQWANIPAAHPHRARDDDDLQDNLLWVTIQKQVKILRDALGGGTNEEGSVDPAASPPELEDMAVSFAAHTTLVGRRDPPQMTQSTVVGLALILLGLALSAVWRESM